MRGGQRHITDLDVYEVSQVLHGAHPWVRCLPAETKHHPGQLETKAMPVRARRRRVPISELDLLRAERIRRDVDRWERESGDHEPYADTVARDYQYELDTAGRLFRVLRCTNLICGETVRCPPRVPVPADAEVLCERCLRGGP